VPLYSTTFAWVMNKGSYERLSANQRKAIDAHCTPEWAEKVASPWADREASGRDKIKTLAGHTVYPLSAAELEQWRKLTDPLSKEWAAGVEKKGLDADAVLGELKAELQKRGAAAF
jgi:TRAP-type C4-dicarboxylate transport system substrate-binding protein